MAKETKELKFEAALGKLEQIVSKLEEGDLPLDDSLKMFEEGVRLARLCSGKLDDAQGKIEVLMKSDDGQSETVPFDPDEGGGKESSGG